MNKKTDCPLPASEPPLKNYQEQPNANHELQTAIENIPVKDYSDYEITVETKEHYEDALFADEDSLEEALSVQEKSIKERHVEKEQTRPEITNDQNIIVIDYSIFLPGDLKESHLPENYNQKDEKDHLTLSGKTLNGSIINPKTQPIIIDQADTNKTAEVTPAKEESFKTNGLRPHEKIFHLGKLYAIKFKSRVDTYLGRDLPERLLPLDFKFAPLKPKKDFEQVVNSYEINKLISSKGRLLHSLLKQADEDLATVIKCELSTNARLKILDTYTPVLFEKIAAIKGTQGKIPPYPLEEVRATAGEHAQNILRHLISGYKQIYSSIYESSNHRYAWRRKTANRVAFRILDLLCLEQNLLNALHKALPPGSAKSFNKMFHVLSRYEEDEVDKLQDSLALEKNITIRKMFLRYQALLSFDLMTLSSTMYKFLYHYLDINLEKLEVVRAKDWSIPPRFSGKAWMIAHDSNSPVMASSASSDNFTAIFIRIDNFFNQIKSDYEECLELIGSKNPSHNSIAFKSMPAQHSLTLMCELNRYITMIEKQEEPQSYTSFHTFQCKIYCGFTASYSWLEHYYAKFNLPPRVKGEPAHALPIKPKAGSTEWQCAMEGDNLLYLQTSETKGSPPMDVGWILFLVRSNEENAEELEITRISRIERNQADGIHLVVEKIGRESINVVLNHSSGNSTPGIITRFNGRDYLLANHLKSFKTGNTFEAIFPNMSQSILQIAGIKCISQQFQLLEIQ